MVNPYVTPALVKAKQRIEQLERENAKLRERVRAYLSEPSIDGRPIRQTLRAELAAMVK